MKKTIIILLVLGFASLHLYAATGNFMLKTSEAALTIDSKGNLKIILGKGEVIQANSSINNLWRVVLRNTLNNRDYEITSGKNVTLGTEGETIRMKVTDFTVENKTLPLKAEFTISVKDDAFCFSGALKSESDEW